MCDAPQLSFSPLICTIDAAEKGQARGGGRDWEREGGRRAPRPRRSRPCSPSGDWPEIELAPGRERGLSVPSDIESGGHRKQRYVILVERGWPLCVSRDLERRPRVGSPGAKEKCHCAPVPCAEYSKKEIKRRAAHTSAVSPPELGCISANPSARRSLSERNPNEGWGRRTGSTPARAGFWKDDHRAREFFFRVCGAYEHTRA